VTTTSNMLSLAWSYTCFVLDLVHIFMGDLKKKKSESPDFRALRSASVQIPLQFLPNASTQVATPVTCIYLADRLLESLAGHRLS